MCPARAARIGPYEVIAPEPGERYGSASEARAALEEGLWDHRYRSWRCGSTTRAGRYKIESRTECSKI